MFSVRIISFFFNEIHFKNIFWSLFEYEMNLKYINFVFVAWISKSKWYCLIKIILSYQIRMLFKYEMHLKNVRFLFFIGDTAVFILSHWWNKDITLNHPKSGLLYSIEPHSSCKSDHFDLDNIYSSYWSFPINTQKISFWSIELIT